MSVDSTTVQISLTADMQAAIEEIMESGDFDSLDDVLLEALMMLRETIARKVKQFEAELQKGIEQMESGETTLYDRQAFMAEYRERRRQGLGYTRENSAALPSFTS